jgi:hypothetical protein
MVVRALEDGVQVWQVRDVPGRVMARLYLPMTLAA